MLVAGAPAQISVNPVTDLVIGGGWVSSQQLEGRQQHSGGAKPALEAMFFPKPFLDRM